MKDVIDGFVYTITAKDITIYDSYTVMDKSKMNEVLYAIKLKHPGCKVFEVRKWDNLISEWKAHSRLYKWGLFKSHTKDVDLDTDEPLWRRIGYTILGI